MKVLLPGLLIYEMKKRGGIKMKEDQICRGLTLVTGEAGAGRFPDATVYDKDGV